MRVSSTQAFSNTDTNHTTFDLLLSAQPRGAQRSKNNVTAQHPAALRERAQFTKMNPREHVLPLLRFGKSRPPPPEASSPHLFASACENALALK